MGGKPAHRRGKARLCAAHHLVVGFVGDDRRHQMLPLAAVGIGLGLVGCPEDVVFLHPLALVDHRLGRGMAAGGDREGPLGALAVNAELLIAVFQRPAGVEKLRAVVERVFDGVVVEILVFKLGLVLAVAEPLRLDWPRPLHPADLVHVMHIVIAEDAAAGPQEAVEAPDLPEEFAHSLRGPGEEFHALGRGVHAIAAEVHQFARLAITEPVKKFLAAVAVAAHQPHAHFEILGVGLGGQFQHPAGARAVEGDRLLHEGVHAFLDRVGKVRHAEGDRRGEDGDVPRPQAVDRLLVGVEAGEDSVVRHVAPLFELFAERPTHDFSPVLKDIGQRHQLERSICHRERVGCRPAPTAATPDQRHPQFVTSPGMHGRSGSGGGVFGPGCHRTLRHSDSRQRRCASGGLVEKLPPGGLR